MKQHPRPVRSATVPGRYSPGTGTASSPTSTAHWDQARRHYAIAVDGFIDLGTPVLEGVALAGLGRCHEADGDTTAAQARYSEALELGRRLGEPSVTASALEGLARLALAAGDRATATARFVEAAGIRERFHRPAPPHERDDLRHARWQQPGGRQLA